MQRFSQLSQAVWIILTLCALLTVGILMMQSPSVETAFAAMNHTLLLPWLLKHGADNPAVTIWVGLLILTGGLLFINTVCCTWCKFILRLRGGLPAAQVLIIAIHVLLLTMLVGHVLNFTWGEKYTPFRLFPGQEHSFGDGYTLKAEAFHLTVDPELLRTSADRRFHYLKPEEFNVRENTATLALYQHGHLLKRQDVRYMGPLSCGSVKCIVKKFFAPPQGDQVGILVFAVKNPSAEPLFIVYILMIACTLAYAFLTWKKVPVQISRASDE